MLRSLLRTVLPLAARRGLKAALRKVGRNAAGWLIAALFVLAALVFALVALYGLLRAELSVPAAAGIMAGGLAAAAALVLAILAIGNRRAARRAAAPAPNPHSVEDAVADAERQAARLMQQIGPAGLLVAAFAIGMSAGRRRGRDS